MWPNHNLLRWEFWRKSVCRLRVSKSWKHIMDHLNRLGKVTGSTFCFTVVVVGSVSQFWSIKPYVFWVWLVVCALFTVIARPTVFAVWFSSLSVYCFCSLYENAVWASGRNWGLPVYMPALFCILTLFKNFYWLCFGGAIEFLSSWMYYLTPLAVTLTYYCNNPA